MEKPLIYKTVRIHTVTGLYEQLKKVLFDLNVRTLTRRSVYHGVSRKALSISNFYTNNPKTVWWKKSKIIGAQHKIGCTISISKNLAPYKKQPLPGKERVLMTIGDREDGFLNIYDGDTIWVVPNLDGDIVILIKQNTENKKRNPKSKYITVIQK